MIDPAPGKQELRKGAALIREHFGGNPYRLSDEEFSQLFTEALWLERFRADMIGKSVGEKVVELFAKNQGAG